MKEEVIDSSGEVRSINRAIDIILALNNSPCVGLSTSEISRRCNISRTTARRILETLKSRSVVKCGTKEGFYMLSYGSLELNNELHRYQWVDRVAKPIIDRSSSKLKWCNDIATPFEDKMVVRYSTQGHCTYLAQRSRLGEALPMFDTTLGCAFLSACSDDYIDDVIAMHAERNGLSSILKIKSLVLRRVEAARKKGFSARIDLDVSNKRDLHLGAIAVPLIVYSNPVAAVNIIYEKSSTTVEGVMNFYYPEIKRITSEISSMLENKMMM